MVTEVSAACSMGSFGSGSVFVAPRVIVCTELSLSTSTIATGVVSSGLSGSTAFEFGMSSRPLWCTHLCSAETRLVSVLVSKFSLFHTRLVKKDAVSTLLDIIGHYLA